MANRKAVATEADIKRVVKGAISAGLKVESVEVQQNGTIRTLPYVKPEEPVDDHGLPAI